MDSVANLLEPIFLIVTLSFIFYFLGRRQVSPLGGPPVLFYATGFFPLYLFIYISRRMRRAISAPSQRFPVEQRLDHILVHMILRFIDYSILGVLLFGGIYILFTADAIPHDGLKAFLACVAIAALGFGWGILNLILSQKSRLWSFFFPAVSRTLIILSGVFFIPDFLSPGTREVMAYNPLMHAVALFKKGFYPAYPAIALDTFYLAACAIVSVFFGILVERVTRRSEGR